MLNIIFYIFVLCYFDRAKYHKKFQAIIYVRVCLTKDVCKKDMYGLGSSLKPGASLFAFMALGLGHT